MPRKFRKRRLSKFGEMLEAWRTKHGLSQRVIADLIGTKQRTLSDWMYEDGMPGAVHQVARLAAFMQMTTEELVGEDAEVAPLRDPEYVRQLLARSASPDTLAKYLGESIDSDARDRRVRGGRDEA